MIDKEIIKALLEENATLKALAASLQHRIEEFKKRLSLDCSNSSKPSSIDGLGKKPRTRSLRSSKILMEDRLAIQAKHSSQVSTNVLLVATYFLRNNFKLPKIPYPNSSLGMKSSFSLLSWAILSVLCAMALVFLSSCAQGPTVDPQVTAAVTAHHVFLGTSDKMIRGQHLDYNDILNLVKSRVPSYIIVGYLRSTEVVYNFTYAQLRHLRAVGATPEVLNYLSETQGFYGNNRTPSRGFKIPKYIRTNSILNQDQQPFFYNEPIVDDWYDSAYEESCYSPFSLN